MIATAQTAPVQSSFVYGKSDGADVALLLRRANRHGLIAGATGTGKTVTLQTLAEGFASSGTPVLAVDVKGDLSGIAAPRELGAPVNNVIFWDVFGQDGHPLRTTVSELGPTLFARLLDLSPAQSGVLEMAFALADDDGLLLIDLKDLRAILNFMKDHKDLVEEKYGLVSPQSVAAIQRALLALENDGGDIFFWRARF